MRAAWVRLGSGVLFCEVAETAEEQAWGLQGRGGLDQGHGMYFPVSPPRLMTVEMKTVSFPLDIVFFWEGIVSGIVRGMVGDRTRWSLDECSGVLEVRAGWAGDHGVRVGEPCSSAPP